MAKAEKEEQLTGSRYVLAGTFRRMVGLKQLEQRIATLEEELHNYQTTHVRLAEVIDLVQELLVPVAQQDPAKVDELVRRFTDELGADER